METSLALRRLFSDINFRNGGDCELRDDGDGVAYISQWRRQEKQPTGAELEAAWIEYQAEQPAKEKAALVAILEAELVAAKAEATAAAGLVTAGDLVSAGRWTAKETEVKARLAAARG